MHRCSGKVLEYPQRTLMHKPTLKQIYIFFNIYESLSVSVVAIIVSLCYKISSFYQTNNALLQRSNIKNIVPLVL